MDAVTSASHSQRAFAPRGDLQVAVNNYVVQTSDQTQEQLTSVSAQLRRFVPTNPLYYLALFGGLAGQQLAKATSSETTREKVFGEYAVAVSAISASLYLIHQQSKGILGCCSRLRAVGSLSGFTSLFLTLGFIVTYY